MTALARCELCGQPMRWGVTTSGARMPLDPDPTPDGNVWIRQDGRLRVLTADEIARAPETGVELYMPHHATCTNGRALAVNRQQLRLELG